MKPGLALCLLSISVSVVSSVMASPLPAAKASRPAWESCEWKPFDSPALGLSLLVQQCTKPSAHYVFSAKGNRLEQHRPSDDRTFGGPLVLEMYSKPAAQSIEQAITEQFIAKLPAEARASCRVEAVTRPALGAGKQAFTLVPTGEYKAKIDKELSEEPRDFGCGEYGKDQGTTYFEYHPGESRTRFAFVVYGMDEPLFDERSLRFSTPRKGK